MNIIQLKYFNTVAATENMSKAAELLHVSQPALSKNISRLEEEIGYSLFTRNGKNLTLNTAGQVFLESTSAAVDLIESGIEELNLLENENEARIKIGIAGSCSQIGSCVANYIKLRPETKFDINGNLGNEELSDFSNYDMLIYPDNPRYKKFNGYPLYTEKYFLAVNTKSPLASKEYITVADLNGLDIIYLRHARSAERIQGIVKALTTNINKVYYVNTRELHCEMIADNIAAGFVTEGAKQIYENYPLIKLLPIRDERFNRKVKIAFKREKHLSEAAINFINYVSQYFGITLKE